jgi:DNA adenine methylase
LTLTQPIKRHGGKFYLADWILSHAPPKYITYCEPYFGGGAVLLRHDPEGHSEVVNDLDGELMNFWTCLADPELFEQLRRSVTATPFSMHSFEEAVVADHPLNMRALRAQQFFIRSRMSRQGLCKDFATMSKSRTRRGMNEQVSQWLGAIEGLPEIHERLKRVVIFNEDALDVIRRLDHSETWFYLDPPYPHETRTATDAYEHECNSKHHFLLLELLTEIKGRFALSGYHCPLYDEMASAMGWQCREKVIDNKASSASTKPQMTECLWMNY